MAIKEESFRIGCGRYLQGPGYLARAGKEVRRVGTAPLVIGDDTAFSLTRAALEESLGSACESYEFITHNGTCNEERAKALAAYAKEAGFDVFVGTGGGVIMDFAKLCAHFAGLPTICIPTSSATCAAYTPMSIRYTPEGKTVGSLHFDYEISGVLVDTEILGRQPIRLLLAGIFDALAKFIEIKQRFTEKTKEYPIGLNYAYTLAKASYELLTGTTDKCVRDMEEGHISHDVENVIFTSIAATGVISGVARGSNQSALAHRFYETTRTLYPERAKPYLHGEIVGVGLLLQNHFNGEEENNAPLLALMKKHNMPCCIEDVGVERTEEMYQTYYKMLCASSAIETEEESVRLVGSLRYLWDLT